MCRLGIAAGRGLRAAALADGRVVANPIRLIAYAVNVALSPGFGAAVAFLSLDVGRKGLRARRLFGLALRQD